MYDVVSLGELLVDFTHSGMSENSNLLFEANPGGAVCNVLAMLSKLGRKTAFIGKVGDDVLGRMLKKSIIDSGISARGLLLDKTCDTTQAFVVTNEDGERDFSFFRNSSADTQLKKEEVDCEIIKSSKIFHFGSLSLTHAPARKATEYALELAKENGLLVSFDPNLRKALWNDSDEAKKRIEWGLANADVVKLADDEAEFLFGVSDPFSVRDVIKARYAQVKMLFVTCGKKGAYGFSDHSFACHEAYLNLKTVDTTGAGDIFMGCVLDFVLKNGTETDERALGELLNFACAAAGLVTTKKGALRSVPEKSEILDILI